MANRPSDEERLVMYQVMAARHLGLDQMVWQVPGLSLTAQAFLMTIGLGPGVGQLARLASGSLSTIISVMSVQLLMRHRRSAIADATWLARFERNRGWEVLHRPLNERCADLNLHGTRLARVRSYRVWLAGLASFGLVELAITVRALFG
jgi:hypothetical protein